MTRMEARAGATAEIKVGRGARNEPSRWIGYTSDTDILGTDEKSGGVTTGVIRLLSVLFYCFLCFAGKTIDR